MKRTKLLLSAAAVLAVVGSALAFKSSYFGDGSVYCSSTCPVASQQDYKIDCSGTIKNPCGGTTTNPNPVYVLVGCAGGGCVQTNVGTMFAAVSAGE